jgi:hypothetical protein
LPGDPNDPPRRTLSLWLRWMAGVLLALLVVASVWYVNAPPRGLSAYRERAADTADRLRSHVQSARLWTRVLAEDRAMHAPVAVGLGEAEQDALGDASAFASHDVPSGAAALRSELTELASDVEDVLASLRIATHRDDWGRLPALAAPLAELGERLERFAERTQR